MKMLKAILALASALYCLAPTVAQAQCNGQAAAGFIAGNPTGAPAPCRFAAPGTFGLPTGLANPTNPGVNLTGSNGVATTAMRSDAVLAINQSILPTWVGLHKFGAGIDFLGSSSGTLSFRTQAAAGTYNFNLPTTAGTSGQFLTSGGGAASPMTWTAGVSGPGSSIANNVVLFNGTSGAIIKDNTGVVAGLGQLLSTVTQDSAGSRCEFRKDGSPLDYGTTRAGCVWQWRDTGSAAASVTFPAWVFQWNWTGNGNVTLTPNRSNSVSTGLFVAGTKTGDASGQGVTTTGQLGVVGPVGYNELCGYCGTLTNIGSTNGYMSNEFLLSDSPDAGTTKWDTRMGAIVLRMARFFSGGTLDDSLIVASSEGNQPLDAVISGNPDAVALGGFRYGINFTNIPLTTGTAIIFNNNTNIGWFNSAAALKPTLNVDGSDNVTLSLANTTSSLLLRTSVGGLTGFSVTQDGLLTTPTVAVGTKIRATGTAPALTSCGTSPAITGSDLAGEVTMGTGNPTGCVITFNAAYASAPYCTVSWQATPLASQSYAVSTTAITLTQTGASSNKVNYTCVARSAG